MPEPDMSVWSGRVDVADGPNALRWHQMVKPVTPGCQPGIVLIGFACDEGVRRNGGRVGAKDGPRAIRKALANFACHQPLPLYDAGDVRCDDGDMEAAQFRLAVEVAGAVARGHRPLVLGGGHETAWGTFQGIIMGRPKAKVGVINIDAHFDLRGNEPGNSGTPFSQIANWCQKAKQEFRYLCVGLSFTSNTAALVERAEKLGARWIPDGGVTRWPIHPPELNPAEQFAAGLDAIHLSIDLDVLPAWVMPAVSAPAARGVSLESIESVIGAILFSGKVIAVDLVELNPQFDQDNRGARVAAHLADRISLEWFIK